MVITFIKILAWAFAVLALLSTTTCIYTWYDLNCTPGGKLKVTLARALEGRVLYARTPVPDIIIFIICVAAIVAMWGQ